MTTRRVHITSCNDLGQDFLDLLSSLSSFLFCHIINSLEQFILLKSRTVTVSEHSPKELNTLLIHLSKQRAELPSHEYFQFKTTFKFLTQKNCRESKLLQGYFKTHGLVDYSIKRQVNCLILN